MSSKNEILKSLRKSRSGRTVTGYEVIPDENIFFDYPVSGSEMRRLFSERLSGLHGELITAKNDAEALEKLYKLIEDFSEKSCLAVVPENIQKQFESHAGIGSRLADAKMLTGESPSYANISAGITGADFLAARTGSIILSAATAGGRRLSVLPPVHIVLAYAKQIVPSLDIALEQLSDSSYITIITGPSRTSDIEKKLVLGAHGPKRLIVILIESGS
jgi:L-lactate dehydrogenase complex protein LldG